MITADDIRSFLNTPDLPDNIANQAIELAISRVKRLLETDDLPDTPEVRKAITLLAISEIASQTNLYWKREGQYEVINVKNIMAEVERLLSIVPKQAAIKWTSES